MCRIFVTEQSCAYLRRSDLVCDVIPCRCIVGPCYIDKSIIVNSADSKRYNIDIQSVNISYNNTTLILNISSKAPAHRRVVCRDCSSAI